MKKGLLVLGFLSLNVFSVFSMVPPPANGDGSAGGNFLVSLLPFVFVIVITIVIVKRVGRNRGNENMVGKEGLISGSGKGHSACALWAVWHIAVGVALFLVFRWLANTHGITTRPSIPILGMRGGAVRNELYNYFMGAGIVFGIWGLIEAFLFPIAISKTRITIFQNKVEGVGVSKYFMFGDARTFSFMYPIDQVSIDVNGGKLEVNGQNNSYGVYVKNGSEIQNALWEAKKRGDAADENPSETNSIASSS